MLDRRTKRQIEWAFYNYKANRKLGAEQLQEIAEQGLTADLERIGFGGGTSNPTESKGLRLQERAKQYLWAKVVENTLAAFRFEAVYDILVDRYFKGKSHNLIMTDYAIGESTYFYRLDRALEYAYMWVLEYELL